jgi:hypothetical protein
VFIGWYAKAALHDPNGPVTHCLHPFGDRFFDYSVFCFQNVRYLTPLLVVEREGVPPGTAAHTRVYLTATQDVIHYHERRQQLHGEQVWDVAQQVDWCAAVPFALGTKRRQNFEFDDAHLPN